VHWQPQAKTLFDLKERKLLEEERLKAELDLAKKMRRKIRPHKLIAGEAVLGRKGPIYYKHTEHNSTENLSVVS